MNYMKIESANLLNGEGCRVVLWVAGCIHACKGCHNPETWNKNNGSLFTNNELEQIKLLLSDKYIDGLTISGGDPLFEDNYNEVLFICKEIKKAFPNKTIWVWTGYTLEELIATNKNEIFNYIDYLIDGKYDKNLPTSKKWRGSDNQKRYKFENGNPIFVD